MSYVLVCMETLVGDSHYANRIDLRNKILTGKSERYSDIKE
jgi:hypothetical protein